MVWQDIRFFYEELGSASRYGFMRQTMFTTKSQPKLQGKASEVKDMGPVMLRIFRCPVMEALWWLSLGWLSFRLFCTMCIY